MLHSWPMTATANQPESMLRLRGCRGSRGRAAGAAAVAESGLPFRHLLHIVLGLGDPEAALGGIPAKLVDRHDHVTRADAEQTAGADDEAVNGPALGVHQHGGDAADLFVVAAIDRGALDLRDVILRQWISFAARFRRAGRVRARPAAARRARRARTRGLRQHWRG